MNVKALFVAGNSVVSVSGESEHMTYRGHYGIDRLVELVPDKVVRHYDMIQSFADSCDVNKLVSRFLSGQNVQFVQREGFYGDYVNAPKDLTEAMHMISSARSDFDSLSAEIRAKFDNDFNKYVASAGSDDWLSALGLNSSFVDSVSSDGDSKPDSVTSD